MVKNLTLVTEKYIQDDIGNEISSKTEKTLAAEVQSITRSEFFAAGKEGYQPELVAVVHYADYDGEPICLIDGSCYQVYRSYTNYETEMTELYLQRQEETVPDDNKTK